MTRTLFRRPLAAPIAALSAVLAVAPTVGIGPVRALSTTSASAATAKPRVSLIGDSTMMAMNEGDKDVVRAGYDLLWDAESCRRLVNPSCRGRFGSVPVSVLPLISTTYRGRLGETLVVMAGYDDYSISSAIDALMAEARAQGVARVVFLTFREQVSYTGPGGVSNAATFARHNVDLQAAAAKYPSLYLADWNAHSAARPDWFYADGIHLSPSGSRAVAQFIVTALGALNVGRCSTAKTGEPSTGPIERAPVVGPAHAFDSIQPVRVLDTRDADLGGADGMLVGGRVLAVPVDAAIPDDASAVIATVTAVDPCVDGFLTVYPGPCSESPPLAATVNFVTGRTTANLAITALGADSVCVFSSVTTDVVVDVLGSVRPNGSRFTAITPARFVDTRGGSPILPISGRRVSHTPTSLTIAGHGDVPADATAVLVNVTAVQPDVPGFVSLYPGPCDGSVRTSTLSTIARRDTGAATIVGIGSDGTVCAHSSMGTDLVVDVQGWFGATGSRYRPQTPTRVLDTRTAGAAPSSSSIPSTTPVLLNVVADRPARPGFLRAAACGATTDTAILNFVPGEITGNVVAAQPGGAPPSVCINASWPSHVVADLSGTFVDS